MLKARPEVAMLATNRRLYVRMVRETPPDLLRWGMRAVLSWPGAPCPDVPLLRVHGDRDQLIPALGSEELVRGGGHLCVMTRAEFVGRLIREWRDGL